MLIVRLQCASAKITSNYGSGDKPVNGDLDLERGQGQVQVERRRRKSGGAGAKKMLGGVCRSPMGRVWVGVVPLPNFFIFWVAG